MNNAGVYSKLFEIVKENIEEYGQKMPFSQESLTFAAKSDEVVFDLAELYGVEDKEKLVEFAYLSLLRRVPDSGAIDIWRNRRWMPHTLFRTFLLSTILASPEFKSNAMTVKGDNVSKWYRPLRQLLKIKRVIWSAVDAVRRKITKLRFRISQRITRHVFNKKGKRDAILINDLFTEEQSALLDGFELFKYAYSMKDSGMAPYYIVNTRSSQYLELKEKYRKHIIEYEPDHRIMTLLRLFRIFRRTKFVCDGYQVIAALGIDAANAIRHSPYVYYIFTQHGVNFFKEDYISAASYSSFCFDKVMVSNDYERELFLTRGCFDEDSIIKNGLFRWDNLSAVRKEKGQRIVFIYFTHRRYLRRMGDIRKSTYVRTIVGLLSDPGLKTLVEDSGYTVKIGIHHSILKILEEENLGEFAEIVDENDIAEVKKNADILITDLSSMCFEMWYQRKPVIFLTIPDSTECMQYKEWTDIPYPYRGKEGYLPNITKNTSDCVNLLRSYLVNGCKLSEKDEELISKSFFFNGSFCERFYQSLMSMRGNVKEQYHVPFGKKLSFAAFSDLNVEGLSTISPEGRWIIKKHASIGFHVPKTDKLVGLQLTGTPMLGRRQFEFKFEIRINGHTVFSDRINQRRQYKFTFEIPEKWIPEDRYLKISFHAPKCVRYKKLEPARSTDNRRISVQLKSLQLVERDMFYSAENQFKLMEE